jgi:hypothetical protein
MTFGLFAGAIASAPQWFHDSFNITFSPLFR